MTPIRIRQLTSQALGEATFVSSRTTSARHRAQAVTPLNTLSKAVSANAGTVGRQAAVLAAASGLVLSVGLPAQAADTDVSKAESSAQQLVTTAVVTAEPTATVSFESPVVVTKEAPKIQRASQTTQRSQANGNQNAGQGEAQSPPSPPAPRIPQPAPRLRASQQSRTPASATRTSGAAPPPTVGTAPASPSGFTRRPASASPASMHGPP